MSLKITGIYKGYQPGDVATFDAAESRHVVAHGLGHVHEVTQDHEADLVDLHRTLPAGAVVAGGLRPSIADPSTVTGKAIPPHMTVAAGVTSVIDSASGRLALERASATPTPLAARDPHVERGVTAAIDVAARGDPYAAATVVAEADRADVSDDALADVAAMKVPGPGQAGGSDASHPADKPAAEASATKPDATKPEASKPDAAKPVADAAKAPAAPKPVAPALAKP